MRKPLSLALLLVIVGGGLWLISLHWPYYLHAQDPFEISTRLESLPEQERFQKWAVELKKIETPRKAYADWGCGIAALGIGLGVAAGVGAAYRRIRESRRKAFFFASWIGSWLILVPGSIFYYWIRFERFDYPTWGDSIAIPIYQTTVGAAIGCGITTAALALLLIRRDLPRSAESMGGC